MKNTYTKGLGAIELLIVFAVLALIVAIVIPQLVSMRQNQTLKSAVEDVLSTVEKARAKSIASYNSSSYGVHFQSDKVIIFKGTSYVSNDANNESIDILSPATISNVTLGGVSGVSGDVYFQRIYGVPSKSGTVTVTNGSSSKIITISTTGNTSKN